MAAKMKNWSRDELILALNLYFEYPPPKISHDHPAVIELSDILNKLGERLGRVSNEKFRSPNGVYMKLCSFLRREYKGKGLQAGGKLEEAVWKQFSNNREELGALARAITTAVKGEALPFGIAGNGFGQHLAAGLRERSCLGPSARIPALPGLPARPFAARHGIVSVCFAPVLRSRKTPMERIFGDVL